VIVGDFSQRRMHALHPSARPGAAMTAFPMPVDQISCGSVEAIPAKLQTAVNKTDRREAGSTSRRTEVIWRQCHLVAVSSLSVG
jgi:hypothetical protein